MKFYPLAKALLFSPERKAFHREGGYCVIVQTWGSSDRYEISVLKYRTQENPYNYYRFSNLHKAMSFLQIAGIPCNAPSWTISPDEEEEIV